MEQKDFNIIVDFRIEQIRKVLGDKAKVYAVGGDRLHNFKVAARISGNTPIEAHWGMAMKHLVCIDDMIKGLSTPTPYLIDEKVGDMINYLILLEALLVEGLPEVKK